MCKTFRDEPATCTSVAPQAFDVGPAEMPSTCQLHIIRQVRLHKLQSIATEENPADFITEMQRHLNPCSTNKT